MHLLKKMATGQSSTPSPPQQSSYFSSLSLKKMEADSKKKDHPQSNSHEGKSGPPKGFIPEKYAIDFTPPTIIMEYSDPESKKRYHHKMVVKKLTKDTNTKDALQYLRKKHYHYFMSKVIDEAQVEKLIERLKAGLLGNSRAGIDDVEEEDFDFSYDDDFEED